VGYETLLGMCLWCLNGLVCQNGAEIPYTPPATPPMDIDRYT